MAKKSKERLESGVPSLEEEGTVAEATGESLWIEPEVDPAAEATVRESQIVAEQEETIRILAEAQKQYQYERYFLACLTGALGYYGIIATDMERVQLLVHEAACQLMASEKARHASLAELKL